MDRFGPAGTAIRPDHGRIGEIGGDRQVGGRYIVHAAVDQAAHERRCGRGRRKVGAHGVARANAQSDEFAVRIQRQFGIRQHIAPMSVVEQAFSAARRPAHRPAECPRGMANEDILVKGVVLHAESAADIGADDTDVGLRDAEDIGCQDGPHTVGILRCRIDDQAAVGRIDGGDRRTRFHAVGRYPVVVDLQGNRRRGGLEGRVGRHRIAPLEGEADIVFGVLPDFRCTGRFGLRDRRDRRRIFVFDQHEFGGVLRSRAAVRDDEGDRLADIADLAARQGGAGRPEFRRRRAQGGRRGVAGHVTDARYVQIVDCPDRLHARRQPRRFGIDRENSRLGMGRAHDRAVQRAGQVHVVDISAAAGKKAAIFAPRRRLTESELHQRGS